MGIYIFFAILIAILTATFIFAYVIFRKVSLRKKPRDPNIHSLFSENKIKLAGEENLKNSLEWIKNNTSDSVCIQSYDGLKLHASLINVENAKGVVIIFHGYRSFGARDFCQQIPLLHNEGYNIMLVDQRSHGQSEGKYICYGTKEHKDALLWRKKASEIYGNKLPIAFFGLSMGGATVLMAS
ncbi:MAG: alpha/beta hydrolase, partial [Ruminococcaceae bacterium]|nr:alpha/beta hydrolase [Oscillospiraceae bacterium]